MVFTVGNFKKTISLNAFHNKVSIDADLTVQVKKEDETFVSYCPELDLSSQGDSIEEACNNLIEVVEIFFEDVLQRGTLDEVLEECGWIKVSEPEPHWVPPAFILEKKIPIHLS